MEDHRKSYEDKDIYENGLELDSEQIWRHAAARGSYFVPTAESLRARHGWPK